MTADDRRRDDLGARVALFTAEVTRLNGQVAALAESVDVQAESTKALGQRGKRHSLWIFGVVISLVVDVLVTVGLLVFYDQQSELIAQQAATTDRLERSVQETCSLYGLILGSYRPESRPPETRDEYERSFELIRRGYRNLDCQNPIAPPATQNPTPPR